MNAEYHKNAAGGRWFQMSLAQQLGNIGSEVSRAENSRGRDNNLFQKAADRALELFDLTLEDPRWQGRRLEIARVREFFCDTALGDKEYKLSLNDLTQYFDQFAIIANSKFH